MTNKKVKYSPKKGRLMEIDGRARRIYWSGDMLSLLRREFPTTINEELAGKIAKGIRKEELVIAENGYVYNQSTTEYNEPLMAEAGDILWQLSGLCNVMGWALEEVAQHNLDKLQARKKAGTIVGNGDGIEREV